MTPSPRADPSIPSIPCVAFGVPDPMLPIPVELSAYISLNIPSPQPSMSHYATWLHLFKAHRST